MGNASRLPVTSCFRDRTPAAAILLSLWLCVPLLIAQEREYEEPVPVDDQPARKEPRFFLKPAKATPAEQIDYAVALQSRGQAKEALKQYRALVHTWHDSPQAPSAQSAYALLLEERGRYTAAFEEFQYLIDHYAGRFPYDGVLDHQFRIARHIMTARHGRFFLFPGFKAPERALPLFEQILENAPRWEKSSEAQFLIGAIHEETGQDEEAVRAYEALCQRYPDSPFAAVASFRRAAGLYRIAKSAPRDEVACRRALSALSAFLRDYSDTDNAPTAERYRDELNERLTRMCFERAEFYDRISGRPRAALIAYRDFAERFPFSELAAKATERIKRLEQQLENQNDRE